MQVQRGWFGIKSADRWVNAELTAPMIPIIVAFSILSIVMIVACHVSRTFSRIYLDPSHDRFMAEVETLTASFDPQQLADWAEKCTKMFLPKRDVDFVAFMQSVTLCTILAGMYNIDPETLSPFDVTFMTNALNRHSDRVSPAVELSAIKGLVDRWAGKERASGALEIISPAYKFMWRLAAVTLVYVNRDQHARNAFLDFNENPTGNQFHISKGKGAKPSVEEVMRFMCHIMHKNRHPWWKRLFSSEMGDIQQEIFDATCFHPKQPAGCRVISVRLHREEWVLMTTALVVAKVIDEVDDVYFTLAGNAFDNTRAGRDTKTWVIQKK